jgi:ATP-binding cassette subfamily C protein CydCD
MKPLDPRVVPHLTAARRLLLGVVAASLLAGALLIAQAFAVAGLIVGLLAGAASGSWQDAVTTAWWLAVVTALRGLVGWTGDVLSARAATTVGTAMRRRALEAALRLGPLALSRRRTGEIALLTTRGVAAVEPYLTRYLSTLVVAATCRR